MNHGGGVYVALVALFFSLAGTAEAALIITKNDQVGPGTIAGAAAPSGDNKNIIAGSVGARDLHSGAVTASKLAPLPGWTPVTDFVFVLGCPDTGGPSCTWDNKDPSADTTTAAYYRYQGVVHLKGLVCLKINAPGEPCLGDAVNGDYPVFQLPAADRPAHTVVFRAPGGDFGTDDETVYIQASTGNVVARNPVASGIWLDGISFRTDN